MCSDFMNQVSENAILMIYLFLLFQDQQTGVANGMHKTWKRLKEMSAFVFIMLWDALDPYSFQMTIQTVLYIIPMFSTCLSDEVRHDIYPEGSAQWARAPPLPPDEWLSCHHSPQVTCPCQAGRT